MPINRKWVRIGAICFAAFIVSSFSRAYDGNSDGLSDVWSYFYFGGIDGITATGDDDNDSFIDSQEAAFGANPMDSSSGPPSISLAPSPGSLAYSYLSVNGISYQLQHSTTLTSWMDIGAPIVGTGLLIEGSIATSGDKAFLRLAAYPSFDSDSDQLTAYEESLLGTSDFTNMSDSDDATDLEEVRLRLLGITVDPTQEFTVAGIRDGTGDLDEDNYSDLFELRNESDPTDPDSYPPAGEPGEGLLRVTPSRKDFYLDFNSSSQSVLSLHNLGAVPVNYSVQLEGNVKPIGGDFSTLVETSDTPGGPAYFWNDISSTGTHLSAVSNSDDGSQNIANIGFSFPFYGTSYSSVWVSANGFISFGSVSGAGTNAPLPSSPAFSPPLLVAPFWDDLTSLTTGDIYYKAEPGKLTIQYENIGSFGGSGTYTFQVVLESSGRILFYYKTLGGAVTSATVGVQGGGNPRPGLQVAYNQPYLHNNMAISISAPWLTASSLTGTLAARETRSIQLYARSGSEPLDLSAMLHLKDAGGSSLRSPVPITLVVSPAFDPNADLNGDGILDGINVQLGQDPTSQDVDGGGIINSVEIAQRTNPFASDSDSDGVADGLDLFPLDPGRSGLAGSLAGDVIAPILTLFEPSSAVLLP